MDAPGKPGDFSLAALISADYLSQPIENAVDTFLDRNRILQYKYLDLEYSFSARS